MRKPRGNYDMDNGTEYFRSSKPKAYRRVGGKVERVIDVQPDKWEPKVSDDEADFWILYPVRVGS